MPLSRTITDSLDQTHMQDAASRAVRALDEGQGYPLGKPTAVNKVTGAMLSFSSVNLVDPTKSALTMILPAIGNNAGKTITVVNASSSTNAITIRALRGYAIGSGSSVSISSAYGCAVLLAVSKTQWIRVI